MNEYTIISGPERGFAKLVSKKIAEGWRLCGHLVVVIQPGAANLLYREMVRDELDAKLHLPEVSEQQEEVPLSLPIRGEG